MALGAAHLRTRRHRRRRAFRRKRHACCGGTVPTFWLVVASVCVVLTFWAGTVARLSNGLLAGESHLSTHVSPNDRGDRWKDLTPEETRKVRGGGRFVPSRPGGSHIEHGWTGPGALPDTAGSASVAGREQEVPTQNKPPLVKSVFANVDYKGGDLANVGPIDAANHKACRRLCVKDGRCLKWTMEEANLLCWLKGAGGTYRDKATGLISGVVRNEEDKSIETPKYGRHHPPPPVECCPQAAAKTPPGVHRLDLWDDQPGTDWTTSYALGNGHMGSMLAMGTFKDSLFMSEGSLWAGKGKTAGGAGFPRSPDRYKDFQESREALLKGDVLRAQEAAGRMSTDPDGLVSSFEYAGELQLEFGGGAPQNDGLRAPPVNGEETVVEEYIRHLHLNNATAEASFVSVDPRSTGRFGFGSGGQVRRSHSREAFASNVDRVLAMRLRCKEQDTGRGCLNLRVAPKREGDSHFSEAWRLPSLDARKTDTVDGGDWNGGNGGYVGLFRPPGGAKDEMGFHMCVAVIPSGAAGGGTGVVVEEMVERPSLLDRGHPNPIHDKKSAEEAASAAVTLADNLGMVAGKPSPGAGGPKLEDAIPSMPEIPSKQHRVALSDKGGAHAEAILVVSLITEGQGENHPGSGDDATNGRDAPSSSGKRKGKGDAGGWATSGPGAAAEATAADGGISASDGDKMRRQCLARLETAAGLGFEELRTRHVEDVEALFDRADISLGPIHPGVRKSGGEGSIQEGADMKEAFCVAGLPIRTRVSRSGMACTVRGDEDDEYEEDASRGHEVLSGSIVDDDLIILMYHYGRYLLISGSRPGGRPLNLQGIWANSLKAKWEGDYHMNINLQMAYWGAHTAGLSECAEPLVPFVEGLSDNGRQTAYSYYRAPGWVSHANADRWGGTAAHGDATWSLCPTCGAWMALHLWEAYEYTRDPLLLLASVVPVLEGAVTFFLEYMLPADDGLGEGERLLTGPSTSPENSLPAVRNIRPPPAAGAQARRRDADNLGGSDVVAVAGKRAAPADRSKKAPQSVFPFAAFSPAMDVSIVQQLLASFMVASREAIAQLSASEAGLAVPWLPENAPRLFSAPPALGEDMRVDTAGRLAQSSVTSVSGRLRELSARAEEALSRLPNGGHPYVGADGLLWEYRGQETSDLPDPGHRHWSGLWALYPGFQISPGNDMDAFEAARATVQFKVDSGGGHTAWSRAWLVNLRARLLQGTEALDSLRGVMRDQCVGSLFTLHPALQRSREKGLADCTNCYVAGNRQPSSKKPKRPENGLVTGDGSVFQIDGNLGILAGVNEMMLQSRYLDRENQAFEAGSADTRETTATVEVRLLPALPAEWPDGRFRGLRTRGGYEIDVEWRKGAIVTMKLRLSGNARNKGSTGNVRCYLLSRTRLLAVASDVGRGGTPAIDYPRGVHEEGVLWYSVVVDALRPGEEVAFFVDATA